MNMFHLIGTILLVKSSIVGGIFLLKEENTTQHYAGISLLVFAGIVMTYASGGKPKSDKDQLEEDVEAMKEYVKRKDFTPAEQLVKKRGVCSNLAKAYWEYLEQCQKEWREETFKNLEECKFKDALNHLYNCHFDSKVQALVITLAQKYGNTQPFVGAETVLIRCALEGIPGFKDWVHKHHRQIFATGLLNEIIRREKHAG